MGLVPIRNLWKPYRVVSKLQAALLSPLESRSGRWLVRLWWLFWLAGSVVSEVLVYTTRSGDLQSGNTRLTIMAGLAVSSIVTVADAALAIAVVRQIQRLSEAREAARRGNPEQAIELVSASQRRRVTLLPFGVAAGAILALVIPLAAVTAGAAAERPWQEFTAPDGAFTISMPGTPVEEQVTTAPGGFSYHTGSDATLVLTVSYLQFPAGALDASKAATALDQVVAAIPGAPAGSVTKVDGHPAETASWSIGATHSKGMFVFDAEASRLYLVEADFTASRAGSPEIDRFIGSFRLK